MTIERQGEYVELDVFNHEFIQTMINHPIPQKLTVDQLSCYVSEIEKKIDETMSPSDMMGMMARNILASLKGVVETSVLH